MASFVVLHGAWHWGACFGKVATELQAAGHSVAMPDLAAHGFDASAPGEVGTMAQYTASARRLIEAAPGKVVLIGHSLGGASCTFLGEQMTDKVEALVYVCAWLAPAGKAPIEYIQSDSYQHSPWTVEINQLIAPGPAGLNLETGNADLL